ncbi:MAG: glycoside hydrolase family 10 [Verrucomicrobia bacterium Tous-C9LFEB]|nr:MAG: glycoside hydrolase family 10 [Verrucomicrobia bacterium Tous-C9LFEB]
MSSSAVSSDFLLEHFNRRDSAVEQRIAEGIEKNRKGTGQLRFVDGEGRSLSGVKVCGRLKRHEFLFGANAFMIDGYDSAEKNARFEEAFTGVFNSAVVPFFWADLEPQPGEYRFDRNSPKVYRRPPPDVVLDFCRKHHLTPKGHCLVWHQIFPKWLPEKPADVAPLIRKRLQVIGERYGKLIPYWDVVNEAMEKYMFTEVKMLPSDYVYQAFQAAGQYFPPSAHLSLNEATAYSWREFFDETTGLDLLAKNLILRKARLDILGLQYHLFFYENGGLSTRVQMMADARDIYLDPKRLFKVLDQHASCGVPMHISEVTLPCYKELANSEAFQADLMRELYRLWFSHASVEAIYWWNMADGAAYGKEGELCGGLLNADLSEKPAYKALRQLVREEWVSSFEGRSGETFDFRGYYGTYELTIEHAGGKKTCEILLSKHNETDFVITLESQAKSAASSRRTPSVALTR